MWRGASRTFWIWRWKTDERVVVGYPKVYGVWEEHLYGSISRRQESIPGGSGVKEQAGEVEYDFLRSKLEIP